MISGVVKRLFVTVKYVFTAIILFSEQLMNVSGFFPTWASIDAVVNLVALSNDAPTKQLSNYLPTLPATHNICAVFVGAMARGKDDLRTPMLTRKLVSAIIQRGL